MNHNEPCPDPVVDPDRLDEIADLDLFSAQAAAMLDEFARRAADRFGMPVGLVSIVLDSSQFFAGSHGVGGWMGEATGTPVEWSFCANTVRNRSRYVVEDAAHDARQCDNPLVVNDGVASYAGAPLVTSRGHVLGSYCIIGTDARHFTTEELDELQAMADEVVGELERHRVSAN